MVKNTLKVLSSKMDPAEIMLIRLVIKERGAENFRKNPPSPVL